jgi:hypothetical protein
MRLAAADGGGYGLSRRYVMRGDARWLRMAACGAAVHAVLRPRAPPPPMAAWRGASDPAARLRPATANLY